MLHRLIIINSIKQKLGEFKINKEFTTLITSNNVYLEQTHRGTVTMILA